MDNLDKKLNDVYPGRVVRKDLLHRIKKGTNVPSFVLEFLLAKYCASDDSEEIEAGIQAVFETLEKNYVRPDEANKAQSLVQQKGKHRFIDKVYVSYKEKEKRHWAEMENFGSRRIAIPEKFYRNNERLLEGGIWAEVTVAHNDIEEDDYAFYIEDLRPIQLSRFDADSYLEGRKSFSRDEWMDILIRSIGLEPDKLNKRVKFHFLARLFCLVEANYNFIELGPRGTGKSYAFSEFSPYSTLVSHASTPTLFYNNARRKVGLVGYWDTVAFDEVARVKVKDKETVDIMKSYMASGRFSRGVEVVANASLAFIGNIDYSIKQLVNSSQFDLFISLPKEFDLAVIDRFYNFLPGWEIPKTSSEYLTNSYGFISDYLAEAFHMLAKQSRYDYVNKHCEFGNSIEGRDEAGVKKTISALLKLLHPSGEPTRKELEEYMEYALEGRRRIKEQLNKRKHDDEFAAINLSFIDTEGKEKIVWCPESKESDATQNPVRKTLEGTKGEQGATQEKEALIELISLEELITEGESDTLEFKSTLRVNLHTKSIDHKIELSNLKTIAAFINSDSGTLLVGIDDNGEPLGLENDLFPNEDKMCLHLLNLIKRDIGIRHLPYISFDFEELKGKRLFVITCKAGDSPVFLKENDNEHFYIRTGPANTELPVSEVSGYLKKRFKK